ncbi:MAG: apolipoprotein N-acyltransferase, partial [Nitrospinae bacterium]|nr:apolipoprotein N-acyltransferase [Nitrospinota bacterium]
MANYIIGAGGKTSLPDAGAAALSGAALALAFPDYHLWPLAWVGLVPLLLALRGKSPASGALLGFIAGAVFFETTIWWIINTVTEYGHAPFWIAALVQALFLCVISSYIAFFGFAVTWIARRSSEDLALASAPPLWVAIEFARGNMGHIAFPWSRLADSQYLVTPIIQIADIVGEEGISFLIVLASASAVKVALYFMNRRSAKAAFPAAWAVVSAALIVTAIGYGYFRLGEKNPSAKPVRVALIQGNIDQARKWDKSYIRPQLEIYMRRTVQAANEGIKTIIWPETAAPFFFGQDPTGDAMIKELSRETGATIIFGSPAYIERDGKIIAYNRSWVVRPDGFTQSYDKVHLVPFGEYVPFGNVLSFVHRVVTAIGEMEPGSAVTTLDAGEFKAGVQICYEVIFPRYSREIGVIGGTALVNITNDSWYGDSPASRQSLAMGVFRAVENRIPMLRAAQSGVSAIVNDKGQIVSETPLFVETTLAGEFAPKTGAPTVYARMGDLFSWLCILSASAIAVYAALFF